MSSRSIAHLHPRFLPQVEEFLNRCERAGYEILLTCTYRSSQEQDELYALGRTKLTDEKGHRLRIVTHAKGGQSRHNFVTPDGQPASLAIDFVPVRYGKLAWGTTGNGIDEDPSDDQKDDLELWQRLGALGEMCGMEWGGRWRKGRRDYPHLQFKGGL